MNIAPARGLNSIRAPNVVPILPHEPLPIAALPQEIQPQPEVLAQATFGDRVWSWIRLPVSLISYIFFQIISTLYDIFVLIQDSCTANKPGTIRNYGCGIVNGGNTCYMAASLQAMRAAAKKLFEGLPRNAALTTINLANPNPGPAIANEETVAFRNTFFALCDSLEGQNGQALRDITADEISQFRDLAYQRGFLGQHTRVQQNGVAQKSVAESVPSTTLAAPQSAPPAQNPTTPLPPAQRAPAAIQKLQEVPTAEVELTKPQSLVPEVAPLPKEAVQQKPAAEEGDAFLEDPRLAQQDAGEFLNFFFQACGIPEFPVRIESTHILQVNIPKLQPITENHTMISLELGQVPPQAHLADLVTAGQAQETVFLTDIPEAARAHLLPGNLAALQAHPEGVLLPKTISYKLFPNSLPRILPIALQRFDRDPFVRVRKNNTPIVPSRFIDIPLVDDPRRARYALKTVLCHSGSYGGGHNYVYQPVRTPNGSTIVEFNDSHVREHLNPDHDRVGLGTSVTDDLNENNYILFYEYVGPTAGA